MRGVGVLSHAKPEAYQHLEFETPSVDAPKDVIIKVHAASINPVDVKKAAGMMKAAGIDRLVDRIIYRQKINRIERVKIPVQDWI